MDVSELNLDIPVLERQLTVSKIKNAEKFMNYYNLDSLVISKSYRYDDNNMVCHIIAHTLVNVNKVISLITSSSILPFNLQNNLC